MKVTGSRPIESASARRATRAGSSSGVFQVDAGLGDRTVSHTASSAPLAAVDTLLALQSVPDAATGRKRALRRAVDMLDLLDDIKIGLLEGQLPKTKLEGLLRVVQTRRDEVCEPGLICVLEEVELRAQVELAKFGQLP